MTSFHQIMTSVQVVGFRMERLNYMKFQVNREVKHTNVYVNVYVCLGICAYYVIMTSSVLNAAKIYKLFITCKL